MHYPLHLQNFKCTATQLLRGSKLGHSPRHIQLNYVNEAQELPKMLRKAKARAEIDFAAKRPKSKPKTRRQKEKAVEVEVAAEVEAEVGARGKSRGRGMSTPPTPPEAGKGSSCRLNAKWSKLQPQLRVL